MTTAIAHLIDQYVTPKMQGETAELSLDFGGYVTHVQSNSQELIDKLRNYFRDFLGGEGAPADTNITAIEAPALSPEQLQEHSVTFNVKQPDPGKSKIKEEWVDLDDGRIVRKRLTGMLFFFGQGQHVALGPCIENDNQVVNYINNRFIEWTLDRGCLLFHAAGVARNGKGLSLAGFSGMGKSTLALHIMNLGTDFVSNDRLMVKNDNDKLTMYGVAKMPRINPGTILHNPSLRNIITDAEAEEFSKLPPEELWQLEHKYDGFIDECYGPGKFKLSTEMIGLVLLNWKHDGSPMVPQQIDLTKRPELMPAFMKSVGLFYDPVANPNGPPDFSESAYLELLADCPVYELSGGVDFEKAAEYCNDLLK